MVMYISAGNDSTMMSPELETAGGYATTLICKLSTSCLPDAMKRLFANSLKPFALSKSGGTQPANLTVQGTISHTTGLQPKYLVPPVPHPCPHDHLSLLVTKDGLLIRPYTTGLSGSTAHVRIAWGKIVRVEEITSNGGADEVEWEKGVIVYGIIGILEMFSGALSIFIGLYVCD